MNASSVQQINHQELPNSIYQEDHSATPSTTCASVYIDIAEPATTYPTEHSHEHPADQTSDHTAESTSNNKVNKNKLYDLADHHHPQFWKEPLPWFTAINLSEKINDPEFTAEHIEVLWDYIHEMNTRSRIYNAISTTMLNKIQSAAMDCAGKFQRGEIKLDLNNLNFEEFKNLGQSLLQSINPEDLTEFTDNLTGLAKSLNINNIDDMFKLMGNLPDMSNMGSGDGQFPGFLSQMFQGNVTQNILKNFEQMFNNKAP